MAKVRVASFSVSMDGFGAGPAQSLEHPLGRGGEALHAWVFPTRTSRPCAAARACASAAWMPPVTKWKVVPPSISRGTRG